MYTSRHPWRQRYQENTLQRCAATCTGLVGARSHCNSASPVHCLELGWSISPAPYVVTATTHRHNAPVFCSNPSNPQPKAPSTIYFRVLCPQNELVAVSDSTFIYPLNGPEIVVHAWEHSVHFPLVRRFASWGGLPLF